jgi:hypothetical protein
MAASSADRRTAFECEGTATPGVAASRFPGGAWLGTVPRSPPYFPLLTTAGAGASFTTSWKTSGRA